EVFNDEETIEIKENDVLYVPPNEPHGYRNTGNNNLIFLCTIPFLE
ncbi:MAG: cupin domain-containing protein, partial [Candidatus Heimdallarchaeota archaeon]|nr:cupin domain-containing protein [Candidatus Heimdallarchaeota archaeon]